MEYLILVLVIYVVIALLGANLMARSASDKGYGSESHILAICFFLGIFGYFYVLSLPDKNLQEQNKKLIEGINSIKSTTDKRAEPLVDELPDL